MQKHCVDFVETFRFLESTVSQDLKGAANVDIIVKKAQKRMYFLRQLRAVQAESNTIQEQV